MAELVDAPDLGSGVFGREGSSPFIRTQNKKSQAIALLSRSFFIEILLAILYRSCFVNKGCLSFLASYLKLLRAKTQRREDLCKAVIISCKYIEYILWNLDVLICNSIALLFENIFER